MDEEELGLEENFNSSASANENLKKNLEEKINYTNFELVGHKSYIYIVKFSKDGNYLMSGAQDRNIKLWNPNKKLMIKSFENIHSQDILDLCINNDNTKFVSCGAERQIYLSDTVTGKTDRRYHGHIGRVNSIALNYNESILVSGSYDCTVKLWDLKSQNREPIQSMAEAKDSISKIIVLNDKIISASVDGFVRIYDIRMGSFIQDCIEMNLNGMDVSFNEKYLLLSGLDNTIRLFDIDQGEVLNIYKGQHKSKNYSLCVKFNPDNDKVYTTSEDNNIVSYDLVNPNKYSIFSFHQANTSSIDFNPMKKSQFVSSGFDGKIVLWEIN